MGANSFGKIFTVTTFGESHGSAIGCVIDGCPAGIPIDIEKIQDDLDRRKPAQSDGNGKPNAAVSSRNESDRVKILSGVFEEKSTGTPIALLIENSDQNPADYEAIKDKFRPGHADYTYFKKYGIRDYRGGGRSSGRETAARVAAGAVAKLLLKELLPELEITASTIQIGNVASTEYDKTQIGKNSVRCADFQAAQKMEKLIDDVRKTGDSVGCKIQCIIDGMPAGIGEPVFDKLDALLAHAMLSIGGVKGIEFGKGFEVCSMTGSKNNDEMPYKTNFCGGILGGISNSNQICFNIAVKPVPSINIEQETIDTGGKPCRIKTEGRNDACLAPRIIPVIEAMSAIVLADLYLQNRSAKI